MIIRGKEFPLAIRERGFGGVVSIRPATSTLDYSTTVLLLLKYLVIPFIQFII